MKKFTHKMAMVYRQLPEDLQRYVRSYFHVWERFGLSEPLYVPDAVVSIGYLDIVVKVMSFSGSFSSPTGLTHRIFG